MTFSACIIPGAVADNPYDGVLPNSSSELGSSSSSALSSQEGSSSALSSSSTNLSSDANSSSNPLSSSSSLAEPPMVLIEAGQFIMAGITKRVVQIKSFKIDQHETTQAEYLAQVKYNPSAHTQCGGDCPVEQVDWAAAANYCASRGKRLPTEAEWEYAARAGATTEHFWGSDTTIAGEYAIYKANSNQLSAPVCSRKPNKWGLCDMEGNVGEWTADWYANLNATPVSNPTGPLSGTYRSLRGGSYGWNAYYMGLSYRDNGLPTATMKDVGFRCVQDLGQ
jgi:formylglycine-generating enzyme